MSSSPVVAEESGWVAAIPADACQEIASQTPNPVAAVKRKPGRPKGSKKKPKGVDADGRSVPAAKRPRKSSATGSKQPQRKRLSMKAVNEILKAHGAQGSNLSHCLMAGIMRGHVKLLKPQDDPSNEFGLDQDLKVGSCLVCGRDLKCTIRDLLYQPDYAGMDYVDRESATLRCPSGNCGGMYVTRICQGNATADSGKSHNHCTECPGFGKCIGDYREAHCGQCRRHFWSRLVGGRCYTCPPNSEDDDNYF